MLEAFLAHKYVILFIGMLLGGETAFLPAAYLVYNGTLSFFPMMVISIAGSVISDFFWHWMGRHIGEHPYVREKIYHKDRVYLKKVTDLFDRYGALFLIFSKFVYGTRTITQILSGVRKFPLGYYFSVNLLGIVFYLFTVFGVVVGIGGSLDYLNLTEYRTEIVIGILIVLFATMHVWIKKILKKM